jgi:membrane-anchored protein YejM (alkaline phosphatase superfamily)
MLSAASPAREPASLRWSAFLWATLHVPVFLWLFAGPIAQAVRAVPAGFRAAMWPTYLLQAGALALLPFLVTLPLSFAPRVYRWAVPAAFGLAVVVLAVDARTFAAVGFHINGFFLRVAVQPDALRETGVPTSDVLWLAGQGAAWLAAELAIGRWFLWRFAARRRTWAWALALLLAAAAERVYVGSLTYFGGPGVFAAGQVLPLQAPVRVNTMWRKITGQRALSTPLVGVSGESALRLPPGVPPAEIRFARTPDVVLVLLESTRADALTHEVMPRLLRRAEASGTVFERHYALSSSTYFTVFGLLFGMQSHKLESVIGAGRRPEIFPAFGGNGYASKFLAASSVDWMGLREQVFGDVQQSLETDWPAGLEPDEKDAAMLEEAKRFVAGAPDRPVFLFLFFVGPHFNYSYPERSARFAPAWDGKGILKATTVPGDLILARAKNAVHEADWKLDEFLDWMERTRGKRPLVVVTGDHGEEMREQGHVGHGSALTVQQIHVPMVVLGDGVPVGRRDAPTSHADVVPTLLSLLGDRHPPELYSDGVSMFDAPQDRFVLASLGWEPRHAAIGKELKVSFYGMDAGLGGVTLTDPFDRPLADAEAAFSAAAPRILRLFGRGASGAAAGSTTARAGPQPDGSGPRTAAP